MNYAHYKKDHWMKGKIAPFPIETEERIVLWSRLRESLRLSEFTCRLKLRSAWFSDISAVRQNLSEQPFVKKRREKGLNRSKRTEKRFKNMMWETALYCTCRHKAV